MRASRKYNIKAYERINYVLPKGGKALIVTAAERERLSANAFLKVAVDGKISSQDQEQDP